MSDTETYVSVDGRPQRLGESKFFSKQPFTVDLDSQWQSFIPSRSQVLQMATTRLYAEFDTFKKRQAAQLRRRKTSFMSLMSFAEETPTNTIQAQQSMTITKAFKNLWKSKADKIEPLSIPVRLPGQSLPVVGEKASKFLGIPEAQFVDKKAYTVGHRRHQSFGQFGSDLKEDKFKPQHRRASTLELPQDVSSHMRTRSSSIESCRTSPKSPTASVSVSNEPVSGIISNTVPNTTSSSLSRQEKVAVARALILKTLIMLEYDIDEVQSVLGDPARLYYPMLNINVTSLDLEKFVNNRKADTQFIQFYLENKVQHRQLSGYRIFTKLALVTDREYHLAQFMDCMLNVQSFTWQIWLQRMEACAISGNVLSMQTLVVWYKSIIKLSIKGRLNKLHVQRIANDYSEGFLESLKLKLWQCIDMAVGAESYASKDCLFEQGQFYLHDKSVLVYIPDSLVRDKPLAAECFRKAFQMGYDVPEIYMRWIWKKKYLK